MPPDNSFQCIDVAPAACARRHEKISQSLPLAHNLVQDDVRPRSFPAAAAHDRSFRIGSSQSKNSSRNTTAFDHEHLCNWTRRLKPPLSPSPFDAFRPNRTGRGRPSVAIAEACGTKNRKSANLAKLSSRQKQIARLLNDAEMRLRTFERVPSGSNPSTVIAQTSAAARRQHLERRVFPRRSEPSSANIDPAAPQTSDRHGANLGVPRVKVLRCRDDEWNKHVTLAVRRPKECRSALGP